MKVKLFVLLSILSIISFSCEKEIRISSSTLNELSNILEENIKIQKDRFSQIENENTADSFEPAKYKYSFLFQAVNKAIWKYDHFYETSQSFIDSFNLSQQNSNFAQKSDVLLQLEKQLNELDNSMIILFDSILTKEYKTIGLLEREMKPHNPLNSWTQF